MRAGLDSRTVAVGALAVLLAAGLGGLAGDTAGVTAGVLAAMAGLVSSAVLAVAIERRARNAAHANRRQELLKIFASPVPAAEGGDDGAGPAHLVVGDVARFLRPEEAVVGFRDRPELTGLLDWCAAPGRVAVRLVTGSGGAAEAVLMRRALTGPADEGQEGGAIASGLFVPKPTSDADCHGCGVPHLGSDVHRHPQVSVPDDRDRYSPGYSVRLHAGSCPDYQLGDKCGDPLASAAAGPWTAELSASTREARHMTTDRVLSEHDLRGFGGCTEGARGNLLD